MERKIYELAKLKVDSMSYQELWDAAHWGEVVNMEEMSDAEYKEVCEEWGFKID